MCVFFRYRFGRSITLTFRLSQVQICNILYINICTVYCRYIFNNIRICALSYCSLSEDLWRLYKNYNSCKCWGCWAVVTQPLWAASDYPAGLHHWSLIPASSNKWSSGCPGMHYACTRFLTIPSSFWCQIHILWKIFCDINLHMSTWDVFQS